MRLPVPHFLSAAAAVWGLKVVQERNMADTATANSHTKQKHEAKRCPLLGCLVVMADGEALYFRFLLAFISSSPGIR